MLVLQNINKVLQIVCKMSISTQNWGKGWSLLSAYHRDRGQVGKCFLKILSSATKCEITGPFAECFYKQEYVYEAYSITPAKLKTSEITSFGEASHPANEV